MIEKITYNKFIYNLSIRIIKCVKINLKNMGLEMSLIKHFDLNFYNN